MSLSVVPFAAKETTPMAEFFAGWKKEVEEKDNIISVVVVAYMREGDATGLVVEAAGEEMKLTEVIGLLELAKLDVVASYSQE